MLSERQDLILVVDNVRSAHNVGTMLRTADAVGVDNVYLTGVTPTPPRADDPRPGHVISSNAKAIAKAALGAELTVPFTYSPALEPVLVELRTQGYRLYALECQRATAVNLFQATTALPAALIVGSETTGLSQAVCDLCDAVLEIPMHGSKGSLNVAVAAGIGLYALRQSASS